MYRDKKFSGFIPNSLELMQEIKFALLRLQWSPADIALASIIPCATRTVKSLDNFHGCKHIVAFTCEFEDVLCRVRDAELHMDENLLALLQSCCDHVSEMVRQRAASDAEQHAEKFVEHLEKSIGLIFQLRAHAPVWVSSGQRNGNDMCACNRERRRRLDRRWGEALLDRHG